jgi:hypothetical protein
MKSRYALLALALIFALASIGTALAHDGANSSDGAIDNAKITHRHHQHGPASGHLPATSSNVQLVSKLALKNVEPDKIADVGVFNGYAYLAAWGGASCKYNGVHVVDIRNPAAPKEAAFIQAKEGSAPGEGIQALHIDTASFEGDILVSNNEKCKENAGFGGLNIYNVSNPEHPTPLVEGFGDETVAGQGKKDANEIHSIFAWDAATKAYAVIVDNEEGPDVDIVDISNPKKPALIAEYDLDQMFPQIVQATPTNLVEIFHHDVVVKEIGGRQIMLVSYWDAGYVKLDVTDPKNATYLADSDFADPDPELFAQSGGTLSEAPEGNGHQAEFTNDNAYIIAADEDFNPTGVDGTTDDGDSFTANPGDATPEIPIGSELKGDTRYVGRACPGDTAVPPAGTANIAVVSRGVCTFTEKIAAIEAAGGYVAAIVVNREGADGCGVFGMAVEGDIPALSVERKVGFDLFDRPGFDLAACLAGSGDVLPGVALGAVGDEVTLRSFFDGWGYVHLFSNNSGKLVELDTFAIPEAMNPAFADGFGDLSVHEVAVSPTRNDLAYFSYYAGGFRVLKIVNDELVEVGRFIDQGGNEFWGVQVFSQAGQEYVAASDMDHGLYIFRYTGSA